MCPNKFWSQKSFGLKDMASFEYINFRDPNNIKYANPVVDIAASIRIEVLFGYLANWGLAALLTEIPDEVGTLGAGELGTKKDF